MPAITLEILLHHAPLEDGQWLTRPLFWPEVSCLSEAPASGAAQVRRLLAKMGPKLAADQVFRRQLSGEPQLQAVSLSLEARRDQPGWSEPLDLRFDVVIWAHDPHSWLAWVPALDIEVYARSAEKLNARLPRAIRESLLRSEKKPRLDRLLLRQRAGQGQLERLALDFKLPSPRQAAEAEDLERQASELGIIQDCGRDLSQASLPEAFELSADLDRLAGLLSGRQGRSVLLVGPSGVGKTALAHELVRCRFALGLPWRNVWETSGARLIAGTTGFGMWQERCRKLQRQAHKQQALLLLGNLYELAEVGKGGHSQLGIAGFLRPALVRGELLAIAECTPEQLSLLERQDPQLIAAFTRLDLESPAPERAQRILAQAASTLARQRGVSFSDEALDTVDRLHQRYGSYSVYPGRPLRFLKSLIGDLESGASLDAPAVLARFGAETGLPAFLLDPEQGFDAAAARQWFADRVQGQPQAIGPVIDLLALLRTRLSQRHKPLASLLLIGPTGTGKTELSKTLAEFLFQDRQRLLRLDMSEYGDALAAARLIGGPGLGEGLLTGRVREQPFCVILLDEFEKADPACFDLLLQVLGEGRLSDGRGRTADFSNAVIIMTSNLGAASFGQPEPGFASPAQAGTQASRAAEGHFRKAVQQFLRPEMYNRIDAIVPFHPLDQATLRALARREWARALQRDGLSSRPLVCELSDEALDYLAARGWDPRYGARPLKRALEREALLPLAAALNLYPAHQRLEARLSLEQGQIQVQVRGIERQVLDHSSGPVAVSGLRRQLQGLRRHELVRQFETQIWRIRQLQRQIEQRPKLVLSPEQQQDLQAAGPIQASLDRLARLEAECRGFELASWQALLQEQSLGQDLQPLRRALDQLLLELYRLQFSQPDRVCLVLIGLEPDWLQELAQGYAALARQRDEKLRLSCYRRAGESALRVGKDFKGGAEMPTGEELKTDKEAAGSWDDVDKPGEWLKALPARTLALALEIQGPGARAFYHGEAGKHLRQPGRGDKPDESWRQALVEIVTGPLAEYRLLPGSQLRGWIGQQTLRRSCFEREREAEDARLWRVLRYERGRLENTLDQAIEALLWLEVRKLLS